MALRIVLGFVALLLLGVVGAGAALFQLSPPVLVVAPEARDVVFDNVTLVEPGLRRMPGRRVTVEAGRIREIGEALPGSPGEGYLLPGLIDMHVHAPDPTIAGQADLFRLLYLAHGVTSVRNTGGGVAELDERRRITRGDWAGPRVFACGSLVDGEPPVWGFARTLENPAGAAALVREHKQAGFDCLKVYERLRPEVLAALVEAARAEGLPVVGHVPQRVRFEEAGIEDVQHLRGSAREAAREPILDLAANVGARLRDWAELTPERAAFIVQVSREQGIVHTPTLVLYDRSARMNQIERLKQAPELGWLPRFYADLSWDPRGLPWFDASPEEVWELARRGRDNAQRLVGELFRAGVRIHAGTDVGNPFLVPGASLQEELAHLVAAGLNPEQAWVAATRWPGEFLPLAGLGRIEPGAPADLLLFREDPTQDLAALGSLEAVIVDGRAYSREVLDAALAKARAHYRASFYESVSMAIGEWQREALLASLSEQ